MKRTPATNSIAIAVSTMTTAAPKSGSASSSALATQISTSGRTKPPNVVSTRCPRRTT